MKHITRHFPHYFSLIGILIVWFLGILIYSSDRGFQIAVTIAMAAAYVTWGIVHHWLHRDLHLSVVIEYIAVAALGLVIVFSLIIRT